MADENNNEQQHVSVTPQNQPVNPIEAIHTQPIPFNIQFFGYQSSEDTKNSSK